MKREPVLRISLLGNVLLAALLCASLKHRSAAPSADGAAPVIAAADSQPSPAELASPGGIRPAEPSDKRNRLDLLRAAGFSNVTLGRLLAADFEGGWEARQRALQRRYENGDLEAAALTEANRGHDAALEKELRAQLGEAGFREWDKDRVLKELNLDATSLAPSESDAVYELRKGLLQQRRDLEQAAQDGQIDQADLGAKLSAAQTGFDQQLRSLLGDDRYAALASVPDTTTADLRRQVNTLHPTDDQFNALLQAQQLWTQQNAQLGQQLASEQLPDDAYAAQKAAADAARDKAFAQALGPEAFAQFQKEQSGAYQTLKQYAGAWQLSAADIDYLYNTLQSYQQSVQDYRQTAGALEAQGQTVDWTGVQKSLQDYATQTGQALSAYLGNDRFAKLKQNNALNLSN